MTSMPGIRTRTALAVAALLALGTAAVIPAPAHAATFAPAQAISGHTTFALLAPANRPQLARETLRVMTLAHTVYGGRTRSCPSSILSNLSLVRGCQDVIITTEPRSRLLITLRYSRNKHYVVHKMVYADAQGIYQWVFAVEYEPSARAVREGSIAVVDVTAVLGGAVKDSYAVFRVLPA